MNGKQKQQTLYTYTPIYTCKLLYIILPWDNSGHNTAECMFYIIYIIQFY